MSGDIVVTVQEHDIDVAKDIFDIEGNDDFARYLALGFALEIKREECLAEQFGDQIASFQGLEQALRLLDVAGFERSGENVKISEAISATSDMEEDEEYIFHVFTVPCFEIAEYDDGSISKDRTMVSGLIRVDSDGAGSVLPCFITNETLRGAVQAERMLRDGLDSSSKMGALIPLCDGWIGITVDDNSFSRNNQEKTFIKAMCDVVKYEDLTPVIYPNITDGKVTSMVVLRELPSWDVYLMQGVRRMRQKRGGKPRLTEDEIKQCLARFNYEGNDEWIQRIMDDPRATPNSRKR